MGELQKALIIEMGEAMELHNKENDEKDEELHQNFDLPQDLIINGIIIRLPIKSLLQFKSISKLWYSTLSSPYFGNAHLKFSPLLYQQISPIQTLFIQSGVDYFLYSCDDENVKDFDVDCCKKLYKLDIDFDGLDKDKIFVIGSCNGLVCLYCWLGYLIIWNPVINQWVKVSCPLLEGCKNSTWGFGYVSSSDEYKVVRISESKIEPKEILVHVLSLRTQKWKQVYDERLRQYLLRGASASAGLLIDESLYWIMYRQGGDYEQDVLGYDLVLDKLNTVKNPVPGDSYLSWVRFLCCMGGCLSMGRFTNRGDMSVTIMKKCGQIDYIGMYRDLELGSCCNAVGFTTDGKFFIQLGEQELGIVNPNSFPRVYTPLVKFRGEGFIDINNYAPSLVSPFAVTEMRG